MTRSVVKTLKWVGLVSGAGLIAISASTFANTPARAAAPAASTNEQVPPKLQQKQPKDQQKNQQNGQPQSQQGGQWQTGQQGNQQNGQTLNQQKWKPQNGQARTGQQGNQQNGQTLNQQKWKPQNGQWEQNQQRQRYNWAAYQPGQRPAQWQQYHQDFNPHSYQWNRTSNQRYHYQHYVQPRGWYYQRWVYGQILPALFWGRDYWLADYYGFGLIDPPYGYVWVRNGNDALLVDVETGQILSVEYNVFYA